MVDMLGPCVNQMYERSGKLVSDSMNCLFSNLSSYKISQVVISFIFLLSILIYNFALKL